VCGEAASEPETLPLLVGLGADELSVGAARVGAVRAWVRALDFEQVRREAAARLTQPGDAARESLERDGRVLAVGPET
jgi:phosphoenolpyruvate-protein kinase (PTS system EI component)